MINVTTHEDFIKCVYHGREYMHFIPSMTGIIKTFGLENYGYGKSGSIIYAHKHDVAKYPAIYSVIKDETFEKIPKQPKKKPLPVYK